MHFISFKRGPHSQIVCGKQQGASEEIFNDLKL